MPDNEEVLSQPVETQETPAVAAEPQQMTSEDISKMSGKEASEWLSKQDPVGMKPEAGRERGPDGKFVKKTTDPVNEGAPANANGYAVELADETGRQWHFRSEEEFKKSFLNGQKKIQDQWKQINEYNAERGQIGQIKQQFEQSQNRINELQTYIQQLQTGATQVRTGQNPNLTTQGVLAPLAASPGKNPMDLIYSELSNLRQELLNEKASNEEIRNKFFAKEQQAETTRGIESLYGETKTLQAAHPELKTKESFEKLDDLVSTYGPETAQTMISPEDWEKFTKLGKIIDDYKVNPQTGTLDLGYKRYKTLEHAYLIAQHEAGEDTAALVNAHKTGMANYEKVLNRVANSATTIPNALAANQPAVMGEREIQELLSTPAETIKANPELRKKYQEAMLQLGIPMAAL